MAAQLKAKRVVVTAGGTREPIDPVRYVGNRSSGKMGHALADAASQSGAEVTLITTSDLPCSPNIKLVRIETAQEMRAAVMTALQDADILIMAAAVADYRPKQTAAQKIKKSQDPLILELVPNPDILREVAELDRPAQLFVVGFAAETENLLDNARQKLREKKLNLIVANDVAAPGIGIGTDDNAVTVIDESGVVAKFERAPKPEIARELIAVIADRLA